MRKCCSGNKELRKTKPRSIVENVDPAVILPGFKTKLCNLVAVCVHMCSVVADSLQLNGP